MSNSEKTELTDEIIRDAYSYTNTTDSTQRFLKRGVDGQLITFACLLDDALIYLKEDNS